MTLAPEKTQPVDIEWIKNSISADFSTLNQLILDSIDANIPVIKAIASHILSAGGKRLRPLIVLLFANHFERQHIEEQIELATVIEFVHTATLLHDDVIDCSSLRRGQQTANAVWGTHAPILVGDYLYSKAFQLLSSRYNPPVMQVLARTTSILAEGEILQMTQQSTLINREQYFDTIYRKTASLLETASQSAAIIAQQDPATIEACQLYGKHLGLAFQITDDVLDYTAKNQGLGKQLGDDIKEGKMTLPLIYAFEETSSEKQNTIREAIENKNAEPERIIQIIHSTSSLQRCQQDIQQQIDSATNALSCCQPSPFKQHLISVLNFIVTRIGNTTDTP